MGAATDDRTPRVVGAGFGRTGTASLKRALELLGFGPCHHMEEVIRHPAEVPTWEAAARGEPVDWRAFLRGWGSTVDFPSSYYYRDLAAAFPDAKVILTVRDPDAWYESFHGTIHPMLTRFPNQIVGPRLPFVSGPFRVSAHPRFRELHLNHFEDRERAIRAFREHNEEVKRVIPAERLLVYEVKEGWEPLCRFLGVPVPDVPFPRVNDTKEFQRRVTVVTIVSWVVLLLPLLLLVALAAWGILPR
jgi:hypothetical protein